MAYAVNTVTDSVTSSQVQTIDGMAMVRRMTKDEFEALKADRAKKCSAGACDPIDLGSESDTDIPFVPLANEEGRFQTFQKGAGILVAAPLGQPTGPQFQPIRIYAPDAVDSADGFAIQPRPNLTQTNAEIYANEYLNTPTDNLYPDPNKTRLANYKNGRFPAHVFKPNGTMEGSLGRMLVYVTASPTALPQERQFVDASSGLTKPVAPYIIELYPTMGRLKITFGETT